VLGVAVLAAVGLALLLARGGVYEGYDRAQLTEPAARMRAPAWTRPCWSGARWAPDYRRCVHVKGRVLWIQKRDPDGDGDRHVIVVSRLHPRIVNLRRELGVGSLPRIGARVDAVGWLAVGASGHEEIEALSYRSGSVVAEERAERDPGFAG
jgi:hypothetical protein